ncbi:MAG TPA: hypothetical protein K8U76_04690, partial [Bilophila wadsworthia]|uniref:hypothetical protein n=1 Tax=Bilophila wadsworthia TaxID=35833 RepID=UPI001DA8B861
CHFTFSQMYEYIKDRGYAIYPGKVTEAETFRIGQRLSRLSNPCSRRSLSADERGVVNRGMIGDGFTGHFQSPIRS